MASDPQQPGRRERNKQEKLRRITEAASRLFAERGVDEVTTQEIADAADIGTGTLFLYAKNKGELLLLVQTERGVELDDTLRGAITRALRTQLSPRHVPDVVEQVPAVPRNRTGKKLELPVKRILLGDPVEQVASRDAVADPAALDHVVAMARLRRRAPQTPQGARP